MENITNIDKAENLAKTFKEFAYVVSHDLGAPLRAMIQFSHLLQSADAHALSEEGKIYLHMIVENGQKAQAMLAGLLEYSRLNTDVNPRQPTDLNKQLQQCREELASKIEENDATVVAGPLPVVQANPDQARRLLFCLLENSLTFRNENQAPVVTIAAEQKEGEWMITVRDNGIGIDPRFHERIFMPFRRLHTDEKYPGIGMGLALAKKVADQHGGKLWLESEPGRGAAFKFTLPVAEVF